MTPPVPPVALLYDDSAYVETLVPVAAPAGERPVALMGRQVAGHEFLDAYLSFGRYEQLLAVVWNQASADTLAKSFRQHPKAAKHELRMRPLDRFLERGGDAMAPVLYTPCPSDSSLAWMRRERGPNAFSLSGVTHTLCTTGVTRLLGELITAPFEAHDSLICTSQSVIAMVRSLTDSYASYLAERLGGAPSLRLRLAHIPLGVNPERYRPATADERSRYRERLNIRPDSVAVLFVGRFTPHAKAHPFPMLQGLARAGASTGRPVHLILSGWAASDGQRRVLLDALQAFAPGVPVSVVNGLDPDLRFGVWKAADVFTSLSDSIQETFGLVIVEAMASGLPVVAADWNGYRDLVDDGVNGLLISTAMVQGATQETTLRLLMGATDYDHFLAECNQAVAVDVEAATTAYGRLITDSDLRRRLGAAGRERMLREFTWERVVAAYEELWREQNEERGRTAQVTVGGPIGPACYPAPEATFAGYPTLWLGDDGALVACPDALERLPRILSSAICSYGGRRAQAEPLLRAVLDEARSSRRLGDLRDMLQSQGESPSTAAATLAWLLKYDLLRRG